MRLKRGVAPIAGKEPHFIKRKKTPSDDEAFLFYFEREKRFEPSTLTLARLCSTS